jgi:hypothetical protein
VNICSLHFSTCTFDLRSFEDLGAIHHFLKGGIDLVACLLDQIVTYIWLEGTLESNLYFVFLQGGVADGSVVILLSICKEIGTL